jgi:CRP/FNR family transcriptional regulator, cyclic AMP receptor protein
MYPYLLSTLASTRAAGTKGVPRKSMVVGINQENLAQMVGTTRSRVSHFMNKFKKLGFIDCNDGLTVQSGLLSIILHD